MFIVMEGPEGGGKSTQTKLLKSFLENDKKKCTLLKEPGSTILADYLRDIILRGGLDSRAELALFFAARADNVNKNILTNTTDYVICDRFVDSTMAYQCYGNEAITQEELRPMLKFFSYNVIPDITFILDVDYETSQKRIMNRSNNNFYDVKDKCFFTKVQSYYKSLVADRYHYIDTTCLTEQETHELIVRTIEKSPKYF